MWRSAAGVLTLVSALAGGVAQAQDKTYVMKITTPTIHAVLDQYAAAFGAAVEKDSGGRIKSQVYPASQLGTIPRQIEGTQFGAIQAAVIPPEFFVGIDERFEVLAAPGLVTSAAQAEKVAADPDVLKFYLGLGAKKGCTALPSASPSSPRSSQKTRSVNWTTSRARSCASSRRSSSRPRSSGWARRRWRCRRATS